MNNDDNDDSSYSDNDNLSYSNDDNSLITHVVTPTEMMTTGLTIMGYTQERLSRCRPATNKLRFKRTFGVTARTMVTIYEDLQRITDVNMRLEGSKRNLNWFLRTIFYLRKYLTEDDIERELNVNKDYARQKIWDVMKKIQYLKHKKITWPRDFGGDNIWVISVDGTHVWLFEPSHPEFSQDSEYFSHKFNKAGINYKLGISLATGNLVWMNGPWKAGKSDLQIFIGGGLRNKLLAVGKKAIGDGIYRGYQDVVSYPNSQDSRPVAKFKSRALKRHKTFNGMTKCFQILRQAFCH